MKMIRVFFDQSKNIWFDKVSGVTLLNEHQHPMQLNASYKSIDDLPKFISEPLAMLLYIDPGTELETIGRRVGKTTYWLYIGDT